MQDRVIWSGGTNATQHKHDTTVRSKHQRLPDLVARAVELGVGIAHVVSHRVHQLREEALLGACRRQGGIGNRSVSQAGQAKCVHRLREEAHLGACTALGIGLGNMRAASTRASPSRPPAVAANTLRLPTACSTTCRANETGRHSPSTSRP